MFPLRLVFLAMGISIVLSTTAFGGESPNDKIDTILSVVYSMRDRIDNIDHMEELTAEKVFFPTFFLSLSFQSFW